MNSAAKRLHSSRLLARPTRGVIGMLSAEESLTTMEKTLADSYNATTFTVDTPIGRIDIRVGKRHPKIDRLMEDVSPAAWAYITAWNPHSELLSDNQNTVAQDEMRRVIRGRGFLYYEGYGIPDNPGWSPEQSVWIAGISRTEAESIGRQFGQNAIVVGVAGGIAELLDCKAIGSPE